MEFAWFWEFWHRCKESARDGNLQRAIHEIGSHWTEWYSWEARPAEKLALALLGANVPAQRRFVQWLMRRWARDEKWLDHHRRAARFVLFQLAQRAPFDNWVTLRPYRDGYPTRSYRAITLPANNTGTVANVNFLQAVAIPREKSEDVIISEDFSRTRPKQVASAVDDAWLAARSLLGGTGLVGFLTLWLLLGRRPYPRLRRVVLGVLWTVIGALILFLWRGPDQGAELVRWIWTLLTLCSLVILWNFVETSACILSAVRHGRTLARLLEASQIRLRLPPGINVSEPGSLGLPVCFSILVAIYDANPELARKSRIWRQLFRELRKQNGAATGTMARWGLVGSVAGLPEKLEAALRDPGIHHVIVPRQRHSYTWRVNTLVHRLKSKETPAQQELQAQQEPKAQQEPRLKVHGCWCMAEAALISGGFTGFFPFVRNATIALVSVVIAAALPQFGCIIDPPPRPGLIAPTWRDARFGVWVSLATNRPQCFCADFVSRYWANRRGVEVKKYNDGRPPRAEISFHKRSDPTTQNQHDGDVFIWRWRRFMGREFSGSIQEGAFSLSGIDDNPLE